MSYYITAYKTGTYPAITKDEIYLWGRMYPKAAVATLDTVPIPTNADWVCILTFLSSNDPSNMLSFVVAIDHRHPVGRHLRRIFRLRHHQLWFPNDLSQPQRWRKQALAPVDHDLSSRGNDIEERRRGDDVHSDRDGVHHGGARVFELQCVCGVECLSIGVRGFIIITSSILLWLLVFRSSVPVLPVRFSTVTLVSSLHSLFYLCCTPTALF